MALIQCDFFSHVLELSTSMTVILPQANETARSSRKRPTQKHPVLYLLHGLSDDHTIWQRRTSVERYVEGMNLAVVMPAVQRSFYTDMASGYRYWTFISQELPAISRSFFPLSSARKDNYVAGLSMGGYGAFKLALSHPERFAAAASLSGVLDIVSDVQEPDRDWQAEVKLIFGRKDRLANSANDLFYLVRKLGASEGPRPRLYQWCGWDDPLYEENLRFREVAEQAGLDLMYEEGPGGHEWSVWDQQIQRVLEWLPLRPLRV